LGLKKGLAANSSLAFATVPGGNGNLLSRKALHWAFLDLKPGDEFRTESWGASRFRLVPVGKSEESDED